MKSNRLPGGRAIWVAARVLVLLLPQLACGGPSPRDRIPIQLPLLEQFEVAEHSGPVGTEGPTVVQGCNSEIAYHLVGPENGRILGSGTIEGAQDVQAQLSIEVTDEAGQRRKIFESDSGRVGNILSIDASLESPPHSMVRIGISLGCEPLDTELRLSWSSLEVDGSDPSPPTATNLPRARYNVFMILLDSLRADHLQPYGSKEVATPRLQALAEDGITFRNARSTAAWTRPAVASLLTSLWALNHGVLSLESKLPRDLPYLPSILRKHGYDTILITNNVIVSGTYGFNRGFTRVHNHFQIDVESEKRHFQDPVKNANEVWIRYIARAAASADERPFFVYLHERDPHSPYTPPPPYDSMVTSAYAGDARSEASDLGRLRAHPEQAEPALIDRLEGLYSGEVGYMDRYVGTLLDHLEAADLERSTLVIFLSDHGEEFWEHESVGHGHTVYEELLRIPLILRLKGVLPEGLNTDVPVDLADVTPSILDLLGIDLPPEAQGASVLPYLVASPKGSEALTRLRHFSVAQVNAPVAGKNPDTTSMTYLHWKLIHTAREGAPAVRQLFNLATDPGEQENLADHWPVVVGTLDQMRRWMRHEFDARQPQPEDRVHPSALGSEVEDNLRALGYTD